jgi:hypothetical protein
MLTHLHHICMRASVVRMLPLACMLLMALLILRIFSVVLLLLPGVTMRCGVRMLLLACILCGLRPSLAHLLCVLLLLLLLLPGVTMRCGVRMH